MSKFQLNLGPFIQGSFTPQAVNIAFVFQVNCPGCFIYGLPAMNNLYQQFKNKVGFIGVSTAFEDFEHNNLDNTQLLLSQGLVVGETKKYLVSQGITTYSHLPDFPIAFDKMSTPATFLTEANLDSLVQRLTQSRTLLASEKTSLQENIKYHYKKYPAIAESFALNQLRGTPSFIIFKEDFTIIQSVFGHQPKGVLSQYLQNSLSKIP